MLRQRKEMPGPSELSDQELLTAAKSGRLAAFGELVSRYQEGVRVFLAVRLGNPHEAEDLAQEAFVTAFRRLSEFRDGQAFAPWVRGIAYNLLRNYLRRHRALAMGGTDALAALADARLAERHAPQQESRLLTALELCLEKLRASDRALLHQRYHEETSVADMARAGGRQQSAVTMHLFRLRQALAACIHNQLNPAP
jgi:RNA polymerase sigma-70 factor (ECF subfamily)